MDYLIQYVYPYFDSIVSNIVIAILIVICGYFRKAIGAAWRYIWQIVHRTYRKTSRIRLSQCFPSHTLKYIKLKRQLRQLENYKQKEKEQDEELEKNLTILLIWASKFRYFAKDEALKAMSWQRPYTHMIFGLAIKREYIKPLSSNHALYSITTEARELLFRRGLLRAHA